jgi:hypothetical protein
MLAVLLSAQLAVAVDCSYKTVVDLQKQVRGFSSSNCKDMSLMAGLNQSFGQFSSTCKLPAKEVTGLVQDIGQALEFALFPRSEGGGAECTKILLKAERELGHLLAPAASSTPAASTAK